MNKIINGIAGVFIVLLTVVGCKEERIYSQVSGTVYHNNTPVQSGVVMFKPLVGQVARGTINTDGTYTLQTLNMAEGVEPGVSKVRVSVREQQNQTDGEIGLGKLLSPERYSDFDLSGLTFDVSPDRIESYDIHMTDSP